MDNGKAPPGGIQDITHHLDDKPNGSSIESRDSDSENPQLCWKCRSLLNSTIPSDSGCKQDKMDEGEPPKRSLETQESITITALAGCPLCQRLIKGMGPFAEKLFHDLACDDLLHCYDIQTLRNTLVLYLLVRRYYQEYELKDGYYIITSKLNLYSESELGGTLNRSLVENHTNSVPTQTLISGWIAECDTSHSQCISTRTSKYFLPSRILDITPGQPIRLVITKDTNSITQYTTLSHCWGEHRPLRLLLSNLADFQEEIPFSALVKSFQDAIHTSRLIGVYYLWIDSLCIIQDSTLDWEEQSAAMASVYLNSYCNISAAHATGGSSGCFKTRLPVCVAPLELHLNWGWSPGIKYPVSPDYWKQNVVDAPLNNRAWVFQERTLAPRNLLFGDTEVLFECEQGRASETFPRKLPTQIQEVTLRQLQPEVDGPRLRNALLLRDDPSLNSITVWNDIVERYSNLQLSYMGDKLIALSAIASEMHPKIGSQYLAGLWREHLPCQLLWRARDYPYNHTVRPEQYIAPSWSWACTHGRIKAGVVVHSSEKSQILIEIVNAHVEPKNPVNPFGQVKSGYISLMGPLAKSVCVNHRERKTSRYTLTMFRINGETVSGVVFDDVRMKQINVIPDGENIYILPIMVYCGKSEIKYRPKAFCPRVSGLVLRRTSPEKHEYIRIGKFKELSVKDVQDLQSACRTFAAELNHGILEEDGWGPSHLITIR